jgi:hypothetical protein
MWNSVGDDRETLRKAVDFLLRYDGIAELRTIRPCTPYPGSPLYRRAIDSGSIKGVEDFYERAHTNSDLVSVNFMEGISTNEAHEELCKANITLARGYYYRNQKKMIQQTIDFYSGQIEPDEFRGFRAI